MKRIFDIRSVSCKNVLVGFVILSGVNFSKQIMVLSNKPTKIKTVIENRLPRPRKVTDREFIELRNEVTELIKWW